jgi:hypothetical protein
MIGDVDQFIHSEIFLPTVLVISTERVGSILQNQYNVSCPTDLFGPFGGYYTPITAQYRVLDRSIRQNGFKVRFVHPSMKPIEEDETLLLNGGGGGGESLFIKWFSNFSKSFQFNSTDCLSQPIATILLVSCQDDNPIDAFEQLSHISNQPELCRNGILDPTSARIKILIDDRSVAQELVDKTLAQLRTIYTQNSVIYLPLEGGGPVDADVESIFTKFNSSPRLSWGDVERLNNAVEQIICGNALPWLERKLSQLDANITAKRKGLRNQLRNFLRTEPQSFSGGNLSLQQVEWQCRLAGDIAFHLRAYEVAFGYYRNICSDLKQEKSTQLAAAGCYEMSGLCGFFAGVGESPRFFDTAMELYGNTSLAIRAAILQSLSLAGRPEAAEKLIRVNGQVATGSSLRSAVVLDHAARLYGSAKMMRKEAFTRVLAGHMFNKVEGGKELALSAYSSVLDLYTKSDWPCIRDHLLFTMAKLEYGLGRYEQAFIQLEGLFKNVANGGVIGTVDKHSNYVKLLMYVAKSCGEDFLNSRRVEFAIPQISVGDIGEDMIRLWVTNPLLVPIDIETLCVESKNFDCEMSGIFQIQPCEKKEVQLMISGATCSDTKLLVDSIQWTLFGIIKCVVNIKS